MAQTVVELSADETKLLRAFQKIQAGQEKVDSGLKKIKNSSRAADKELAKFAEKTKQINTTKLERYKLHVSQLDAALKKGLITQETYNRAIARAGAEGVRSFGATAASNLQNYAIGMVGISSAVMVARSAINLLHEDTLRAVGVMDSLVESGRGLNQIVQGAPRDALGRERNRLGILTGVPLPQIENLQFTAESLKMAPTEVEMITRAAGANLLTTEAAGNVGGEVPLVFGNNITAFQGISGMLKAASESPANFEEMAAFVKAAAEGTAPANISPMETMSALSLMREKFDAATAAARINRFAANLAQDKQFEGKTLVESVKMLEEMPEEQRNKFLGDAIQVRGAYDALVKLRPRIAERTKQIEGAMQTPEQDVNALIAGATDPRFKESNRTRLWQQRNISLREQEVFDLEQGAAGGMARQTAQNRERLRLQQHGYDPFSRVIRRKTGELFEEESPATSRAAQEAAQWIVLPAAEIYRAFRDMLSGSSDSLERAATNLENASSNQQRAVSGVAE